MSQNKTIMKYTEITGLNKP